MYHPFPLTSRVSESLCRYSQFIFFFFNDTATTEIYTLSLHDALPILYLDRWNRGRGFCRRSRDCAIGDRSEEHTSELQSRPHLVCRLLLEKKKNDLRQAPRMKRTDCEYNARLRSDICVATTTQLASVY